MTPRSLRSKELAFADRVEGGRLLAAKLTDHRGASNVVVVGLPRGGVPTAFEVADTLGVPMDVILVRKIGLPFQPELAMGAIGEDGITVVDEEIVRAAQVTPDEFAAVKAMEQAEIRRRSEYVREGRDRIPLAGQTVIIVDDGVATGSTARAACLVARAEGAARVILAVPVAPVDWTMRLAGVADELIAVATPEPFYAVGQFYRDFTPTTDDEVVELLDRAAMRF